MRLYPDVNVLIALFDPAHQHHLAAHRAFQDMNTEGWVTCPVVENGFMRVISNPAYLNAVSVAQASNLLRSAISNTQHVRLDQSVSLIDTSRFHTAQLVSHKQITDLYLLGMAVFHDLKLITFDQNMPMHAVMGFEDRHLLVL